MNNENNPMVYRPQMPQDFEIVSFDSPSYQFMNPANGYVEEFGSGNAFLGTLLIAPIYFASKGIWTHFFVSILVAIFTCGISWLIYPFFASSIIKNHYKSKGWVPVRRKQPIITPTNAPQSPN